MRIIDRYLLREYLLHLTYCLLAFAMVLIVWDLFDHMGTWLAARPPVPVILEYYAALLAIAAEYLLPSSMLLATLYTLWQLAHNSELSAMRASGVGLYRIVAPFLSLGVAASVATACIKEFVAPECAVWIEHLKDVDFEIDAEEDNIVDLSYVNPSGDMEWRIHQYDPLRPHQLAGVEMSWTQPDDPTTKSREVRARRVKWLDGEWWFFKVKVLKYSEYGLPIGGWNPVPGSESGIQLQGITQQPRDFQLATKRAELMSARELHHRLVTQTDLQRETRSELETEMHARFSLPWACLILTLFGIPAGSRSNRQGIVIVVFAAIAMLLGFYALTITGIFLGKRGIIQPWLAAWFSNIVFLLAGSIMLRRMR